MRFFSKNIDTERLKIRPIHVRDIPSLVEIFKSKDVAEHLHTITYPFTHQDGRELLELMKKDMCFGVSLKNKSELIGAIWLRILNTEQKEIGYVLDRAFWGQGLIKEAIREVIQSKVKKKTKTLIATTTLSNERSQQVLKDLGFECLGVFERDYKTAAEASRYITKWQLVMQK
ncbi:MAG: GNAT family N-acetyltransferase [Alphaproteobacteria bacterium]|nr:GNAT family N-acetyltransferase [Alphaproteobacteria bacterium]MCL2504863.1 GNAT family N-acetyltransferase [Alphaproteobacteria bacterium]